MRNGTDQRQHGWLAVRLLDIDTLLALSDEWAIVPAQVASVVETSNGTFTLFFDPTTEQRRLYAERERHAAGGG